MSPSELYAADALELDADDLDKSDQQSESQRSCSRSGRSRKKEAKGSKPQVKESTKQKKKKRKRSTSSCGNAGSEDDEQSQSEPAKSKKGKAKAKPKRGVGKRKGGKAGQGAATKDATPTPKGNRWKRCTSCKKHKDAKEDFHADQSKCKKCVADLRAFGRAAEQQSCSAKMASLAKEDPATYEKVLKAWIKEREKNVAAGTKLKFSIMDFTISLRKTEGSRSESKGRMMWKAYFLTWAQSIEGGSYSEKEAEALWKQYEADPKIPKDQKGPHGHTRCKVPMFDDVTDYSDLSKQRELAKREKVSKKVASDDAAMSSRVRMLLGAGGEAVDKFSNDWEQVQEKMVANNLDSGSALEPNAEELLQRLDQQRGRPSTGSSARGPDAGSDSYSDDDTDKESEAEA